MSNSLIDGIRRSLHSILKRKGFSRKSSTWNRPVGEFIQVIHLQTGKFTEPNHADFTLNLGVFSERVFTQCWQKTVPSFINEVDCVVRTRIGALVGDGSKDVWCKIEGQAEVGKVADEVLGLIDSKVLPFLDRFNSLQAIDDFLVNCKGWNVKDPLNLIYLAVIKKELGDLDGAHALLKEAGNGKNKVWTERVSLVAKNLGL